MGGRAAEQVVLNTMTNGASQDIQEATNLARNMVAMFGMIMPEPFAMPPRVIVAPPNAGSWLT